MLGAGGVFPEDEGEEEEEEGANPFAALASNPNFAMIR